MCKLTVHWPDELNEHNQRLLWFGSWLIGGDGEEAGWFYSGRGNEVGLYPVPDGATGTRLRRWPSEGIDAEYVDVSFDGDHECWPSTLDFDVKQEHSRLPAFYDGEASVQA